MNDISGLLDVLLSLNGGLTPAEDKDGGDSAETRDSGADGGGIDVETVLKLGELMSRMNESDKNTDLLIALKPHLRDENKAKIDTAVRLFKVISLLPYLKESGLIDGFNG